ASSATRSTVVPCIPYRAITRRAASRISRTRNSLITSSFVMARLNGQSNECTVSLPNCWNRRKGEWRAGKCRPRATTERGLNTGCRGHPCSDRRVLELIAQNFGQPLGRKTAQIGKREARRRDMTAAAIVLRED